eukprot:SAG11_NODE_790_length_7155_cov_217.330641_1_plen_202_part_00
MAGACGALPGRAVSVSFVSMRPGLMGAALPCMCALPGLLAGGDAASAGPAGADAGALPALAGAVLAGVLLSEPAARNSASNFVAVPSIGDGASDLEQDGATRTGWWSPKVISTSSSLSMVRSARSEKSIGSYLMGLKAGRSADAAKAGTGNVSTDAEVRVERFCAAILDRVCGCPLGVLIRAHSWSRCCTQRCACCSSRSP